MNKPRSVSVIGAGSWGTALAQQLAGQQYLVRLWGRNSERIADINRLQCNQRYLPDLSLSERITGYDILEDALFEHELILLAIPSSAFRHTIQQILPFCKDDSLIAWACKGLEYDSGKRLDQILLEEWPGLKRYGVISGPTFAKELAAGLPTAITVAGNNETASQDIAHYLHGGALRCYTSSDITGVELGGAIKNVLAIAAGITDGLQLGANTRAALITRGLNEMVKLGVALGGELSTFYGLAGMGDLILTCTDDMSRNRQLGLALGQGKSLQRALSDIGQVVEGVGTAREVFSLAQSHNIDMPISNSVYRVLYENLAPSEAVTKLLERELKAEDD